MPRKEGRAPYLSAEQFQQVIDHTLATSSYPERDCAILQTSYRVGLRAGEIALLTLEDVVEREVQIRRVVVLRKKITKGKKGVEAFFTHPEVRSALSEYLKTRQGNSPYLFVSRKNCGFSPSSMSRLFSTLYRKAGFEGKGHTGRKSLAMNLNEQNVSVFNISRILRHANIQTTVQHYINVNSTTLAGILEAC
jgi:integrase/recombinase XerD